ncbi:MAG: heavy-metal-associated domain-containing protein [Flavobacteriales bacterium]
MKTLIATLSILGMTLTGCKNNKPEAETMAMSDKAYEFKVYGNCGMCEKRIEKAANSVEGVLSADWSKETKMMKVEGGKQEQVEQAITQAGHDTENFKAEDSTYNELPGCCQYDRK